VSRPVLVTGGQGFVGAHLLRLLDDAVAPEVDVTDAAALRAAVRELAPRAVVHLAALSQVSESFRDPVGVWQVNAIGTVNLLESVRGESPDARVLVVSTGEIYGRADVVPTPETEPPKPRSPYAASKAAAEIAALQSGLDVVVARAFQHEGPGRDDRFAVGSWTLQLAQLEQAGAGRLRVGNLDVERDITDVRDVCRAYQALLSPAVPGGVYNVASGGAVPLRDAVARLVALCRVPVTVEPDPERMRASDVPVVCGDPAKLHAATGWKPEIPLERTLSDTLDSARAAAGTGRMPG
jgi:GDP-4-dehydro-6-deoxy-D-mannose reductase